LIARQNSGGIKHSPSKMPSVTGAHFPECFETAEPKVVFDSTTGTDTTDDEFAAVMAQTDALIAKTNKELNESKVRMLEHTVACLKNIIERQRDAFAKHRSADEPPVVSCYSEVREIVKTLSDGISNPDVVYKDLCLSIALRSVRDLVDVLCEKTDNSGGAVIGDATRRLLDNALAKKAEPTPSADDGVEAAERRFQDTNAWVKAELTKAQRKNDETGVNAFKHLQNRMEAEPKPVANGGAGEPRPTRYWLHVPFDLKEDAKRLGAQWDSEKRKWFASKQDSKLFKQFEPVFIKCAFGTDVDDLRNDGATWNRELKRWVCHRGSNAWRTNDDYLPDTNLDWMDLV